MERSLEHSWVRRNLDSLGVAMKTAEYFCIEVKRVLRPPSQEIQDEATGLLLSALNDLGEQIKNTNESKKIGRIIEDVLMRKNPVEELKKQLVINTHFWLQALRAPEMKKYGTELKFLDLLDDNSVNQSYLPSEDPNIIIENRIENLPQLEVKFKEWAEKNDIKERLENGSLILSTNHDTWLTQPISLYLFQHVLGISPENCTTILGPRLQTFNKFMFDPEKLMRGLGRVITTVPPTENGRHEAFDEGIIKKSGMKYVRTMMRTLKESGNIASIAFGASRDKTEKMSEGTEKLVPVTPSDEALVMADTMLNKMGASIAPIGFRHSENVKLERIDQQIKLKINFGDIIDPGDAEGETSLERGQWIHQQMVDQVPN